MSSPEYLMGPKRGDLCDACQRPITLATGWVRHIGEDTFLCGECHRAKRKPLTFGGALIQRKS